MDVAGRTIPARAKNLAKKVALTLNTLPTPIPDRRSPIYRQFAPAALLARPAVLKIEKTWEAIAVPGWRFAGDTLQHL
jgi:hypothetical protein